MTCRPSSHSGRRPGRMALVDVTPEGVLRSRSVPSKTQAISPRGTFSSRVKEHRLALGVHVEALLEKVIVVDDVLVERQVSSASPSVANGPCRFGQIGRNTPPGTPPASPGARGRD